IRRFYELGQVFQPKVVVLQFCRNDPTDNLDYPVTAVAGGIFRFQSVATEFVLVKVLLSNSLIQKSQFFNLLRYSIYNLLRGSNAAAEVSPKKNGKVTKAEINHVELLEAFARDLKAKRIPLVMIAVPGDLKVFPYIESKTREFERDGLLHYIEVTDWTGP